MHTEPSLTSFQFFLNSFYYRPNFSSYWPTISFESTNMNCASYARLSKCLKINFFTWNDLVLAEKNSKECIPNYFCQVFNFLFILPQAKFLLLLAKLSVLIDSFGPFFLYNGSPDLRNSCL